MPDGTRLAARAWLPEGAAPGTAILEYLPYRKRDGTRRRDETLHPVFAARGYPSLRVDVRGTGDSEGVLLDEYSEREIDDGLALLRWIAAQPWCDGRVVLLGKSWGGINALMVATRDPPELAGVVSVCATDDRYGNDAHAMGGRLLAENLIWGVGLMAVAAHPPDPRLYGPGWRDAWLGRLEAVRPYPSVWMEHPTDDAYWRRDSARHAAARIRCPVLLVGGTEDPYRDAIPRLLDAVGGPASAILGPWAHLYPHLGRPGPALDFPRELLGWLDRHTSGAPPTEPEPRLLAYVTEGARDGIGGDRPGRWIACATWPPVDGSALRFGLGAGRLVAGPSAPGRITIDSPVETGLGAGGWCRFGGPGEGPYDQRGDDRGSALFDTPPLATPLVVLGRPVLHCERVDGVGPGLLCARLTEVFADGRSERIAYGLLDLAGVGPHVELPLELTAHRVRRGSRLRLALSTAYWPVAWPLPGDGPVALRRGGCALEVPCHEASDEAPLPAGFPAPAPTGLPPEPDLEGFARTVSVDEATGTTTVRGRSDLDAAGRLVTGRIEEIDLEHGHGVEEEFTVAAGDPSSARGFVRHVSRLEVPGHRLEVTATGRLRTVAGRVVFDGSLEASENDRAVFARRW
jgi:predicted acyl esterase